MFKDWKNRPLSNTVLLLVFLVGSKLYNPDSWYEWIALGIVAVIVQESVKRFENKLERIEARLEVKP